jgi:hypothetical protein
MRRLLQAALALLLAAPSLPSGHAAAQGHSGVRPREEVYAAVTSPRAALALAPVQKRGTQPGSGVHPPAFIPQLAPLRPQGEVAGTFLRPSRAPVPRSAKRPGYYATAPPR